MEQKKMNKNALRSRKLIRQAFFDLLKEKTFEKITATDVIKRAEINRSTFYVHYQDIRGIMDEIKAEIIAYYKELYYDMDINTFLDNPEFILRQAIEYMLENKELYQLLWKSKEIFSVLEELKKLLLQTILENMTERKDIEYSPQNEIRTRFILGGLMELYRSWLLEEANYDINAMTKEIDSIISECKNIFIQKENN